MDGLMCYKQVDCIGNAGLDPFEATMLRIVFALCLFDDET